MKQHMLTHKIRDMFGNSNSGDESRMSSGGGHTSDSSNNHQHHNNNINFAMKLDEDKNGSQVAADEDDDADGVAAVKDNGIAKEPSESDFSPLNGHKWRNKLNEMPENIAAS